MKRAPTKLAGRKKDQWIQCEECKIWHHDVCINGTTKDLAKDEFICKDCKTTF